MASVDASCIRSFVQSLNQTDRYLVLLHYADGLSEMEVAAVLKLGTLEVRERLAELREQMQNVMAATPQDANQTLATAAAPRTSGDTQLAYFA